MDALACLEDELLARQVPDVHVLDLDLGSAHRGVVAADEIKRWCESLSMGYERCGHVAGLASFRSMVWTRASRAIGESEVVVLVTATTTDQWRERRKVIGEAVRPASPEAASVNSTGLPSTNVVPVFLSKADVVDGEAAKRAIAEALLRFWGVLSTTSDSATPRLDEGKTLGDAVRLRSKVEPYVLAVCGNEKQKKCLTEYPLRVQAEFGIEGEWLFTDYGRPERVVDQIRELHGRIGQRLVAVLFSQRFNATNVKRDGQAYLRSAGVLSITRDFKSTGSALEVTRHALTLLAHGTAEDDEPPEDSGDES